MIWQTQKLTDSDNRQVVKAVKKNPKSTLEEVAQNLVELNIVASQSIIRRTLHSEDIYGRKAVKKPFISEINRKKRYGWCNARKHWENK